MKGTKGCEAWAPAPEPHAKRQVLVALIGLALIVVAYYGYTNLNSDLAPPHITGKGYLFESESTAQVALNVSVTSREKDATTIVITVFFPNARNPTAPWALVLTGGACFSLSQPICTAAGGDSISRADSSVKVSYELLADPPLAANPERDVLSQVITGLAIAGPGGDASTLTATPPSSVVTRNFASSALVLPKYGKVAVPSPLLANYRNGYLGVAGNWLVPANQQTVVDAGPGQGLSQRLDVASPELEDASKLAWETASELSVSASLTNTHRSARQQSYNFAFGALLGVGTSFVAAGLVELLIRLKRRKSPKGGGESLPT